VKLIYNITIVIVACLAFTCCSSFELKETNISNPTTSDLFPFNENGLYGYVDAYGIEVIKPQFTHAHKFSEGLGLVGIDEGRQLKYGFIDTAGNFVIPAKYHSAIPFIDEFTWANEDPGKHWGVIDKEGKYITDTIFSANPGKVWPYYNGHTYGYQETGSRYSNLIVFNAGPIRNYNCNYIDSSGTVKIVATNVEETNLGELHQLKSRQNIVAYYRMIEGKKRVGFTKISDEDFHGPDLAYDSIGERLTEPIFIRADQFVNGYAKVNFAPFEKGYIDTSGHVIIRYVDDSEFW